MTQLVYPFTLVPGQPENVNQLNDNLGAIQSVVNGNIGADNIQDGALDFPELSSQVQNGLVDNLQAGVVGATHGQVTYASAAGVSVAAGTAWVPNAAGLLRRVTWGANAVTVPVSTGTRLDQIVVDSTGTLSRVAGTEQAAGVATLDNRTGNVNPPTGTLRLADLLITTAGVVNSTSNIRDRRPWARGAEYRVNATDIVIGGGGGAPSPTVALETGGNTVWVTLMGDATSGNASTDAIRCELVIDGVTVFTTHYTVTGSWWEAIDLRVPVAVTAGRHTIVWNTVRQTGVGIYTIFNVRFGVEESLRASASN